MHACRRRLSARLAGRARARLYPSVITEAATYLNMRMQGIALCTDSEDGRVNSIKDEDTVIACLEERFRVKRSKYRFWHDMMLLDEASGRWLPINIKVSMGGVDNCLNKKALVYSYSTLEDKDIPACMNFNRMVGLIEANAKTVRQPSKEYYYLWVDKRSNRVVMRSLCDVRHYTSNPQNWLQINWDQEGGAAEAGGAPQESPRQSFERVRAVLGCSLQKLLASSSALLVAQPEAPVEPAATRKRRRRD